VDLGELRFIGVTHHRSPHGDSRVGFAFLTEVGQDLEPVNREPEKCACLAWADPAHLPEKTMPYTSEVIRLHLSGEPYSLHGWR